MLLILNVLLYHNIQYASVQYWIPTYLASGFFSLYCPDYIAKRKGDTQMLRSLIIMVSLWLVLVFMRIFGIRGVSYYKYVMWFCAPYFLIDISEIFGTSDHAIYESEFFLYCAHQPVIYCIEAVVRRFAAPETQNERAMAYIIVVAATIGVCSIAYFLLSKTRKRKILKLLYGLW